MVKSASSVRDCAGRRVGGVFGGCCAGSRACGGRRIGGLLGECIAGSAFGGFGRRVGRAVAGDIGLSGVRGTVGSKYKIGVAVPDTGGGGLDLPV